MPEPGKSLVRRDLRLVRSIRLIDTAIKDGENSEVRVVRSLVKSLVESWVGIGILAMTVRCR